MARQTIQGVVTKAGVMAKTVTMTVEKKLVHPKLLKEYTRHKKYLIHDEENKLALGDKITVEACRPLSARKRFTLLNIDGDEKLIQWRRENAKAQISAEDAERSQIAKLIKAQMMNTGKASPIMTKTQSSKTSKTGPVPAANPSAPTSKTNRVSATEKLSEASSSNPTS